MAPQPRIIALLISLFLTSPLLAQAVYTTGFEPPDFTLGDVNGQNGWGHLSNSPTTGYIEAAPAGSPAMFGTQSLAIRTLNTTFFGVQNHLYSPTIDPPAGEPGSVIDGTPAVNPQSVFYATLWVHTPPSPVISTRSDGRFAELNPSSKAPGAAQPANRYAQVRLFNTTNDASGVVRAEIGWYTSNDFSFTASTVALLGWDQWYRFDYLIHFVNGLDGTAPNDKFTLTIYDVNGVRLGSACGSTWESEYSLGIFGGGTGARAVNGFDLWSQSGPNGNLAAYIDNMTMTASTPADALAVTVDGSATACFGGTTTLTANAGGGAAAVASYEWRDGSNTVVGTNPTFNAGAGSYTVTVTNELCETASSESFVVTEDAALAVAITGENTVAAGETTPLNANVSGGSGTINNYVWRDAQSNVVGNSATFQAGPGTYTVTVNDATCGAATSAPFTVTQAAAIPPVPTAGNAALFAMLAGLAIIALVRMR